MECGVPFCVLILTNWNVNQSRRLYFHPEYNVLILTNWNVNLDALHIKHNFLCFNLN